MARNVSFFDMPVHGDHLPDGDGCLCGSASRLLYVEVTRATGQSIEFWKECLVSHTIIDTISERLFGTCVP